MHVRHVAEYAAVLQTAPGIFAPNPVLRAGMHRTFGAERLSPVGTQEFHISIVVRMRFRKAKGVIPW
jgi:hypothetical protein